MRRLVLLSNSTNHGAGYLDHAMDAIGTFLGPVRRLSFAECQEVARRALALTSIEDVWELVRNRVYPDLP